MKYLIVGLGNIGSEYEDTRHNIGFSVLDAFAKASSAVFTSDRLAHVAEVKFKGRTLVLIKPTTFMNLSGKAVNYWLQHEKISPENMLVITDDLALPFGKIRIRPAGSDGGHNGLKDIQAVLGHNNYPRLRFGIGAEFAKGKQSDYVLGKWGEEENKTLTQRIELCCEIIKSFSTAGLQRTMNDFNNR
ncbi:MAG: aminoacyl-tRNA hydrolase [Flavobacteriales bacterium]